MSGTVKRTIDVEELLVWVYQRQRAHQVLRGVGLNAGEATAAGLFVQERSMTQVVAERLALGCAVDGSKHVIGGRGDVHPDAEAVHAVVMTLPADLRSLLIRHAERGDRPDWMPGARMRFVPRLGWRAGREGREAVSETLREYYPGARVRRSVAVTEVRVAPSPELVLAERHVWLLWRGALDLLHARLPALRSRSVVASPLPVRAWPKSDDDYWRAAAAWARRRAAEGREAWRRSLLA